MRAGRRSTLRTLRCGRHPSRESPSGTARGARAVQVCWAAGLGGEAGRWGAPFWDSQWDKGRPGGLSM